MKIDVVKTRGVWILWDKSTEDLTIGWAAIGVEGA